MSLVSGMRGTNSLGTGVRKYDHADKLFLVDPDYAVLAFFARKLNKLGVTDPEYRWFDKAQPSRYDAVNTTTNYTSGAGTIAVDDGTKFRGGDVIMDVSTGEQMHVDSVSTNDLSVDRGWGSTSATTCSNDDVIVILGNANAEGTTSRTALSSQRTKRTNYTQIFREPFDVTGTEDSTELWAEANDISQLRREHLQIHMKDIERSFMFGEAKEDLTGSQPIRATGGLRSFISTNVSNITSANTGTLTEALFEDWVSDVFTNGGDRKMGFLSPLIASAVNSWAKGKLQMFPKDKTYGISIAKYLTIHGELDFVVEKLFAENSTWAGYGFAVDMGLVGYRYLNGNGKSRDTRLLKNRQANDADEVKEEYLSEIGFWLALENRHGFMKGVTGYA